MYQKEHNQRDTSQAEEKLNGTIRKKGALCMLTLKSYIKEEQNTHMEHL